MSSLRSHAKNNDLTFVTAIVMSATRYHETLHKQVTAMVKNIQVIFDFLPAVSVDKKWNDHGVAASILKDITLDFVIVVLLLQNFYGAISAAQKTAQLGPQAVNFGPIFQVLSSTKVFLCVPILKMHFELSEICRYSPQLLTVAYCTSYSYCTPLIN